jgi:heptosyltransferase-2
LLTRAIPVPAKGETPTHEVYDHLELLRRAGWLERLPHVDEISIRVADEDRQNALERLVAGGVRKNSIRIAFASGAAYGSAKCWEPERYAALADRLIAAFDAEVILFGAPQENEMAARIVGAMRHRACNLVGATKIGELPALLSACRLFIGNDSGAMHVAGAVGVPVIGIFGPSDPEATRAMTPQFTLIREPVECSPCFLRKCPIDHRCMTRISVERVFETAQSLLTSGLTAGDRAKSLGVWSQRLA